MKGKKIRTWAVIGLLMAAMAAAAVPVKAEYTTRYLINTGQEISFLLHGSDDERVEVIYYPNQVGNRKFEAWHSTPLYLAESAGMSFYWTDNNAQTLHLWRKAAVGFYWPKTTENLYSGSTNIGYRFVFKSYQAPILTIHVKIT